MVGWLRSCKERKAVLYLNMANQHACSYVFIWPDGLGDFDAQFFYRQLFNHCDYELPC